MCFNKCDHIYKCYNRKFINNYFQSQHMFYFVCLKCESKLKISENSIISKLNKYKAYYNKNIALRKIKEMESSDLSVPSVSSFSCDELFRGGYVTMLIEFYKSKGIDITEIEFKNNLI